MSPPVSSPPVWYKLWGHHVSRVREQRFEHEQGRFPYVRPPQERYISAQSETLHKRSVWPDPEPQFGTFSKTRDFGDDGGRVGGMLFDNPPRFFLKISFIVRKNPDGPPDVVKTAYPEAYPELYPEEGGSGTSRPLE